MAHALAELERDDGRIVLHQPMCLYTPIGCTCQPIASLPLAEC